MSCTPVSQNYLALGCSDSLIRVFDRRYLKMLEFPPTDANMSPPTLAALSSENQTAPVKLFKIPSQEKRTYRVTSVVYSPNDSELLVSFSSEYLYIFDMTKDGIGEAQPVPKTRRLRRRASHPKILRKIRLRGDWSDTGPDARPQNEVTAQSRPQLNSGLMNRMTGLLSRMLNDPRQRNRAHNNPEIDENNIQFDRVAEGISIMFRNDDQLGDIASTSQDNNEAAVEASSSQDEQQADVASSNSSSSDESSFVMQQFDYVKQKFIGHRNARTMIKEANFYGDDFVSLLNVICNSIFNLEHLLLF